MLNYSAKMDVFHHFLFEGFPKGVPQGLYNGVIESYYKNASISIGGWKLVIEN